MSRATLPRSEAEQLATLTSFDVLTGLPDRALLADRLAVALAQAERHKELVALVVIDLDKTTEVRAALGLEAGEELTAMVADRLGIFARKSSSLTTGWMRNSPEASPRTESSSPAPKSATRWWRRRPR